jgi:1,4-alpha-glucan branching enzyme
VPRATAPQGYFALVLHAHLPYVHHPEQPRFLEEEWLFEALSETYLPLLDVLEGLQADGVPFRLTLSLSPTLLSMLTDPTLQQRYVRYLDERLEALAGENRRTRGDRHYQPVVHFYIQRYTHLRERYVRQDRGDILPALRQLLQAGMIDVLTSAATHAYLPLLAASPETWYAQLSMGIRTHQRLFGVAPRGFWLPECGYRPGLDAVLAQYGIEYFFLDSHGLLNAEPRPRHGVHRPVRTPGGPVAFGRDYETARQVWSHDAGYPGHRLYRDFHCDAGFEVDAPHLHALQHAGQPGFTGLKYHRVTAHGGAKKPYQPERAAQQALRHAQAFLRDRHRQLAWLEKQRVTAPLIVAPYDAELFGHWWFEGPQWIDALARSMANDRSLRCITPSDYLQNPPRLQTVQPPESSWGAGGFHEVWLNDSNHWIYPHLQQAAQRMSDLARRYPQAQGVQRELLDQAARELLLAQASDWPFIMHAATTVDYAIERCTQHLRHFARLADMLSGALPDLAYMRELAARDALFPDMDYRIFQPRPW